MRRSLIWLLVGILTILSACITPVEESNETAVLPTATPQPANTPLPQTTPDLSTDAVTPTSTTQTFIIWIPPDLITRSENGARLLNDQLSLALANHPELQIRIEQKSISGQGGMLSYLRTGRNVAPNIMPDLVILRTDQLAAAAADSLIYPVDSLLEPLLFEDLYPAAYGLVHSETSLLGYPFALTGLSHLSYNSTIITDTLPSTWTQFTAVSGPTMTFPAAGRDGALLGLRLYISAGGTLVNEAGQPDLQPEPLTQALEQINSARQSGFILAQSSTLTTLAESWQMFQNGSATIVATTSDQVLQNQVDEQSIGFAPIPGINNRVTPFVSGWAWCITSPDPAKQAIGAEVITFLSSDVNLAEWSYQTYLLPARRSAMHLWPQESAYVRFIQRELELAQAFPITANSTILNAIGNAVFDVVSLTKSPQVAAEEAVATLQQ
ncbi:MAG: extracellular solute-binding protein [Ardenticatenaceae bacterium]|nr:extracellular solute-binding protein [Ardenticatenaceae bacterium]